MYNNILVPIAPGDAKRSVEAMNIAKSNLADGGRISAVTVLEVPPAHIAEYFAGTDAQKAMDREEERMIKELNEIAETEVHVVHGHPARKILDEAERLNADCIVIASHRPGPSDFLIGSTALRVVRRAVCTVIVAR